MTHFSTWRSEHSTRGLVWTVFDRSAGWNMLYLVQHTLAHIHLYSACLTSVWVFLASWTTNTFHSHWYDTLAILIFCLLTLLFIAWLQLKELFPIFGLALPPKRWFKDNYDEEFLEERQIGLQTFLQSLTLHKDIISRCVWWRLEVWLLQRSSSALFDLEFLIYLLPSEAVRHFLCLVDPPSPFDSLEESRVRSLSSQ